MKKMITAVVGLSIITVVVACFGGCRKAPVPKKSTRTVSVVTTNDLGAIYTEIEAARQESAVQASNVCLRLTTLETRTGGLERNQSANTLRGVPLFGSGVAKTGTNSARQKVNVTVHGGQAGLMPVIIQQGGGSDDQTVDITITNNPSDTNVSSTPVTQAPTTQKTWSSANSASTHTDWGPQANTSPWVPQPLPEVQAAPVVVVGYGYPRHYGGYGYGHSHSYSSSLNVGFRIGNGGGFSRNSYYNSSRNRRNSRQCL